MPMSIDPERKKIVSQVLEYWYTTDFLNQGALHTEETRRDRENYAFVMKHPGRFGSLYRHVPLKEGGDITDEIARLEETIARRRREEEEESGRTVNAAPCCHGRITVYLGSTSRAFLTARIARDLDCDPPANPSADKLAWAALQLNEEGKYIRGTFSLSPVIWAAGRIALRQEGMSMYEVLDPAACRTAREALAPDEGAALGTYEALRSLADRVFEETVRPIGGDAEEAGSAAEIHCAFSVYRNPAERLKRENEDYYGLSMSFYAEDLAGFKNTADSGKWLASPMWSALLDYICAPYDMGRGVKRPHTDLSITALRDPETSADARRAFRDILSVENAPLGKWPSRYRPFLMQQAAVNLAVGSSDPLFAVNGPPGTGKTTLLKEIVADNVVRRARILASCNVPDSMFTEKRFSVGGREHRVFCFGQEMEQARKYAIVAASSNNAAVENISKQLPLSEGMEKNLSGEDGALSEVRDLFTVEKAPCETVRRKNFDKEGQPFENVVLRDIYFSSWATELMHEDCWGLVSAPLGKRSNVAAFYTRVLKKLRFDFYRDPAACRQRLPAFQRAREAFLARYDRVLRMRAELAERVKEAEARGLDSDGCGDDAFTCLTDRMLDDLCSDDAAVRGRAQMACPRITRRLDREREKLFRDALALTKEFILSSERCKSNFALLGMAWDAETYENIFAHASPEEKAEALRQCMTPLIQTLQLLVPVISTTFASSGRFFKYVNRPGALGMIIVDEAGQATPQSALRLFSKASRAVIVGDPNQIDPVVTDETAFLGATLDEEIGSAYSDRTVSVQKIADFLSRWGGTQRDALRAEERRWIGVPLYVHSRCVEPMFSVSNRLSYGNAMLRITREPDSDLSASFCYDTSQWINVRGREETAGNHFIRAQGERILALLETAFMRNAEKSDPAAQEAGPDLFIITPFHTAAEGMRQMISNALTGGRPGLAAHREAVENWLTDDLDPHIGTVHTFQGREANEVIFMLGCDENSRRSAGWVSRSIVNVAVSRAKYRLYVVGDAGVWSGCEPVMEMKYDLDSYAFDQLAHLSGKDAAVPRLPSCEIFETDESGEIGETGPVDPAPVVRSIQMYTPLFGEEPEDAVLRTFGMASGEEMRSRFSPGIRQLLLTGIHIYRIMKPLSGGPAAGYDASFVGICFCKALEMHLKETYLRGFRLLIPDAVAGGRQITALEDNRLTLGVYSEAAGRNAETLGRKTALLGGEEMDREWWTAFHLRVQRCKDNRNDCCHPGRRYSWEQLESLVDMLFRDAPIPQKDPSAGPRVLHGLMFETAFRTLVDRAFPEDASPPPDVPAAGTVRECSVVGTRIRTCPEDGGVLTFGPVPVLRRDGQQKKICLQHCGRCGRYYISRISLPDSIRLEDYDLVLH